MTTTSELVSKPYSFTKAMRILSALENGERPYIGMAFGLDAKCSGPQYGAIMTGDRQIAAATGFIEATTKQQRRDAYERAVAACEAAGIHGTTRANIKKAYMGIFYGQGSAAFGKVENYGGKQGHNIDLLPIIMDIICAYDPENETELEAQAKMFHSAIESSFGEMRALRSMMKAAHYEYVEGGIIVHTTRPTMYDIGDGTWISMDYKEKIDINGNSEQFDVEFPDVDITIGDVTEKFPKMGFKTKNHDLVMHGRSGFVNMIQGTDALVARHIVSNMGKLGAQHTIAVHDCFRTNINDYLDGKLHKAIEEAYVTIFAKKTEENGDILSNYFKAVRLAGGLNKFGPSTKMFMENGMSKVGDVTKIARSLQNENLGKTEGAYYFAK